MFTSREATGLLSSCCWPNLRNKRKQCLPNYNRVNVRVLYITISKTKNSLYNMSLELGLRRELMHFHPPGSQGSLAKNDVSLGGGELQANRYIYIIYIQISLLTKKRFWKCSIDSCSNVARGFLYWCTNKLLLAFFRNKFLNGVYVVMMVSSFTSLEFPNLGQLLSMEEVQLRVTVTGMAFCWRTSLMVPPFSAGVHWHGLATQFY